MIPLKQGIMRKKTHIFYLRLRQQDLIKWVVMPRRILISMKRFQRINVFIP